MEKTIMGRTVEYSVEERIIRILRNEEDKERYEKAVEEDDLSVFADDYEITKEYFDNPEFLEIHRLVFPATNCFYPDGFSWQQEEWDEYEKENYIDIRVIGHDVTYDFEIEGRDKVMKYSVVHSQAMASDRHPKFYGVVAHPANADSVQVLGLHDGCYFVSVVDYPDYVVKTFDTEQEALDYATLLND